MPHSADDLEVVGSTGKLIPSHPPPHALWSARVEGTGKLPRMEGGGCGLLLFLAASAHADQRERWWKQTEFFPDTMHCLSSGSTASEDLQDEVQGEDGTSIPPHTHWAHFFSFTL